MKKLMNCNALYKCGLHFPTKNGKILTVITIAQVISSNVLYYKVLWNIWNVREGNSTQVTSSFINILFPQ